MAWASVRCKPQASALRLAALRDSAPRAAPHVTEGPLGAPHTPPPTVLGNHLQLPEIALRARGQDLLR